MNHHLYAQINVKPDTPAKAIAAELTDLLTDGLYERLKNHPELIQKTRDPDAGGDVYSVKLIFVRHRIDPATLGERICTRPPDVHPEDAWAEESRNLDCPLCGGSGHVDDVCCKHTATPPCSPAWPSNKPTQQSANMKQKAQEINELKEQIARLKDELLWVKAQPDLDEQMYEEITLAAKRSYQQHYSRARGTTITRSDSYDTHVIWATLAWVEKSRQKEQK